jgi:phosphatidate cytidylyltransferase
MKARFLTGAVLVIILLVTFWLGSTALVSLLLLVNALACLEYHGLIYGKRSLVDIAYGVLAGSALILCGVLKPEFMLPVMMITIFGVFIKDISRNNSNAGKSAFGVWGVVGFSLPLAFAAIMTMTPGGLGIMALAIAGPAVSDGFAFFCGKAFGRHKLAPLISPNKTVEGAVFGFLGCVAFFWVMSLFDITYPLTLSGQFYILFGVCIGVLGQYGDLAASLIKRHFAIKDYSQLFPGHGGMVDRLDSIVFSFTTFYVILTLAGKLSI